MQNFDIVKFLRKSSFENISKNLLKNINNTTYCDNVLGEGMFGTVSVPAINSYMSVQTSSKQKITLPVVIKNTNNANNMQIEVINGKMYIYGYLDITLEAIILAHTNKLWHKQLSPHLPFMIGYSCCTNKDDQIYVDKIITERHGMPSNVKLKMSGFNDRTFWHSPKQKNKNKDVNMFDSNIATLDDLIQFILIKKKDDTVTLPNQITCNVIDLLNYITISYIHTHNLLHEHGITLHDMHFGNIFIHWLNDKSYIDDKYIGNTKYIYYKINKKIIRIKTFGIIIKIGDFGSSIVQANKKVYVLGQANNLKENIKCVKYLTDVNFACINFLLNFKRFLPYCILSKLIVNDIITTYPYSDYSYNISTPYKLINDFPSTHKLLTYYSKYFVDKIVHNNHSLVIE